MIDGSGLGGIGKAGAQSAEFQIKVAKAKEDSDKKTTQALVESTEDSSTRESFGTGEKLNVSA